MMKALHHAPAAFSSSHNPLHSSLFWLAALFPRHGTCSGLDQLSYFMTIYQASLNNNLMATLAAGQITPSNSKQYRVDQVGGTKGQITGRGGKGYAEFAFVWNQGERRAPNSAASCAPLYTSALATNSLLEFCLHFPLPVLLGPRRHCRQVRNGL